MSTELSCYFSHSTRSNSVLHTGINSLKSHACLSFWLNIKNVCNRFLSPACIKRYNFVKSAIYISELAFFSLFIDMICHNLGLALTDYKVSFIIGTIRLVLQAILLRNFVYNYSVFLRQLTRKLYLLLWASYKRLERFLNRRSCHF